jgi:hypothetical protein
MDALFNDEKDGLVDEMVYSRICGFLTDLVENEALDSEEHAELRAKSIELVLRIGLATGSAQHLVTAAFLQHKHKVNIASHLEEYVGVSEKFVEPASTEQATGIVKMESTGLEQLQSKCRFKDDNNRQQPINKGACNGEYYFNWSEANGLTRAKRKPEDNNWDFEASGCGNKEKEYAMVSFLVQGKKLFMRHKDTPVDTPFQAIKIEDMTIDNSAPKITFEDDNTKMRFKKTTNNDASITNEQGDKRWIEVMPMCTDGKHLYTMVEYHAQAKFDSDRKAIHLEKYEFKGNKVKFLSSKQLKRQDGENWVPWAGRGGRDNDGGGFLNYGLLACNGTHAVWCSRRFAHIFDTETGKRVGRNKVHSGREHITMYDFESSKFYGQDADVYSWLKQYEIPGFEQNNAEEEEGPAELPPIKFNLDEKKNAVKNSVPKNKKPGLKANVVAQLMGGEAKRVIQDKSKTDYANKLAELEGAAEDEENKDNEEETFNSKREIFDWSRAIILAHVSKGAQMQNFYARKSESTFSTHDTIKKFFKTKQAISSTSGMFAYLREAIMHSLEDYELSTCDISE